MMAVFYGLVAVGVFFALFGDGGLDRRHKVVFVALWPVLLGMVIAFIHAQARADAIARMSKRVGRPHE